jgi:hypothetical protein
MLIQPRGQRSSSGIASDPEIQHILRKVLTTPQLEMVTKKQPAAKTRPANAAGNGGSTRARMRSSSGPAQIVHVLEGRNLTTPAAVGINHPVKCLPARGVNSGTYRVIRIDGTESMHECKATIGEIMRLMCCVGLDIATIGRPLLLLKYVGVIELPSLRVLTLLGSGQGLSVLRNHRFHCIEKLSVRLFHYDIDRMVAYFLHGYHDGRGAWGFDFVRLAIPRNRAALVDLLAIGIKAGDGTLHFIPHRLEGDRHLFQFGAGREFGFGRIEFPRTDERVIRGNQRRGK